MTYDSRKFSWHVEKNPRKNSNPTLKCDWIAEPSLRCETAASWRTGRKNFLVSRFWKSHNAALHTQKRQPEQVAFFVAGCAATKEGVALFGFGTFIFPRGESELLPSFLGEGVSILVLDEAVEVKICDALSNSSLADMKVGIFLDPLPKVPLQHSKTNVTLVLDFVHVNDVENHVVVLVQIVHGQKGVGFRFAQQLRAIQRELAGRSPSRFERLVNEI